MIELNLQNMGVHIPPGCNVQLVWGAYEGEPYCEIQARTGRRSEKVTVYRIPLDTLHYFKGESQMIVCDHLRSVLSKHYNQPFWP